MWYAYVLQSAEDKRLYVGVTNNLRRRIKEHDTKRSGSYTNKNGPFKLIFYEASTEKKDAAVAEKFYKSGYGREVLKNDKLKHYFKNV